MRSLLFIALLALPPLPAHAFDKHDDRIARLLASTDGSTKEKAFKVKSVEEEYEILAALKLKPGSQDLVIGEDRHPYDMISAVDGATGRQREVWFDIRSFYGKELGL